MAMFDFIYDLPPKQLITLVVVSLIVIFTVNAVASVRTTEFVCNKRECYYLRSNLNGIIRIKTDEYIDDVEYFMADEVRKGTSRHRRTAYVVKAVTSSGYQYEFCKLELSSLASAQQLAQKLNEALKDKQNLNLHLYF